MTASFYVRVSYDISEFDSLMNHSFESDLFKDSVELVHTNGLNDMFTNRMQNVKHTGNMCMKLAYMEALSTNSKEILLKHATTISAKKYKWILVAYCFSSSYI